MARLGYLQMWPTDGDDAAKVVFYTRLFEQVRIRRVQFETQWEESAALAWPDYRNKFTFGHVNSPGTKYTQHQLDSAASIASHRFGAITDTMMTPNNLMWSKISCDNKELLKDRAARQWFEDVTNALWQARYTPEANFIGQNQVNWQGLGVFGNMGMYVDELYDAGGARGLSYRASHCGEIYLLINFQGRPDGFVRHLQYDARQAEQLFGRDKLPSVLVTALEQQSKTLYNFLHFCHPNQDYRPWEVLTAKGKKWASVYLSWEGRCILEEGGYRTFPMAIGRYMVAPEEDYGRGPAQMVLPALKTLNSEKAAFLKQAQLAGDPAYLIGDDGLFDFKTHSGAYNYGGMTADGKRTVDILPAGQISITEKAMEVERGFVDDAFLVSLFKLMFNDAEKGAPQRSAREVIEYAAERGIFLAPTVGSQFTQYLAPLVDRELDCLSFLGKLPPRPPSVKEAKGEYKLVYKAPLALAAQMQEIAGGWQTLEQAADLANKIGDPGVIDTFEVDEFLRDAGEVSMMRETWFSSPQSLAKKRKGRADAAKAEQDMKALPGQAAIMKAQAITAKAQTGGNIGGTLSGTPQGGMPVVPGNPPGTPGQPSPGPGQPGTPGLPARAF